MEDAFLSTIGFIGTIVLIIAALMGIQWMMQQSANLSGRRQVFKVNGATFLDVSPNNRPPTYIPPPSNKPKNKKVFIYNPVSKTIEITYVE